ncbi:aminotransferase class I/II-fold pyridoxal phosphate-dependent enzyme [Roseivirga echinicomitans]|uniref:Methionine gamma-lyase n=1 Tax=Roseivirga echinicomitans TaxID=296218 RepID=A0A150X126_9BACT|nr:aminotransferase class I/II-fold pyridoxal phosphate-dependent enzyme [Roseivirga echinicomitans]KYG72421.1 methionine gamma-lyase [Roseivirga echinicomitans]
MTDNPNEFSPESLMMSFGHDPSLVRNSIKNPIFQTSTFEFATAEEGKAYFEKVYGGAAADELSKSLIYTRLNHPNLVTAEKRLSLLDESEESAFFESGMAAITTSLLEICKAGDLVLMSFPIYGGTDAFIKNFLPKFDVQSLAFSPDMTEEEIIKLIEAHPRKNRLACIYVETPANPTNTLIDIEMTVRIAARFSNQDKKTIVAVDNTYMGPLWQKPINHGADLIMYSATKYIGGHSDLIAGAISGSSALVSRIKKVRSGLGCMASPWTSWLISRSLETISLRMEKQASNAAKLADFLRDHPKVAKVYYVGHIAEGHKQYELAKRQMTSGGAMLAFDVVGGEAEAFRFLNAVKLAKLAVSLGSTETLTSHPFTMSSSNMSLADREAVGITPSMVRISTGIENPDDLLKDFAQAFEKV